MRWILEQGPGAISALILSGASLLGWSAGRSGRRWAVRFLLLALAGAAVVLAAAWFMAETDLQLLVVGLGALMVVMAIVGVWAGAVIGIARRLGILRPAAPETGGRPE
jgi:FtsH-binding integral membrane protein